MQKHKGALPAWRLRALISRNQTPSNFFLLYGPDIGQNHELTTLLANSIKNHTSIKLSGNECKDNPYIILQQMRQIELFNTGIKIITIFQAEIAPIFSFKSIAKELDLFTGIVIAKSENLSPKNELRKWANYHGATIACYPLSSRNLEIYVSDLIIRNSNKISITALKYLLSYLEGNDTAVINNEIEKLILFIGDNNEISLTNIQDCLNSEATKTLDVFISLILEKNPAKVISSIDSILDLNSNITLVLRTLLKTWNQIKDIHAFIEDGASIEKAIDSLQPAVFFKTKNMFLRCIHNINSEDVSYYFQQTLKAELNLRRNIIPKNLILRHLIVSIATYSKQPVHLPIAI